MFAADPFEVADQERPEIYARRQPGPSHRRRVELRAQALHMPVEPSAAQLNVKRLVKRVTRGARQILEGYEEPFLLFASFPHRHVAILHKPRSAVDSKKRRSPEKNGRRSDRSPQSNSGQL